MTGDFVEEFEPIRALSVRVIEVRKLNGNVIVRTMRSKLILFELSVDVESSVVERHGAFFV